MPYSCYVREHSQNCWVTKNHEHIQLCDITNDVS